jgi:peptidoglycan glycosyltransferase
MIDKRLHIIAIVFLVCFGILFLQLNNLQFKSASSLVNSKYNPRKFTKQIYLPRGEILTSDGQVLAESVPVKDNFKYLREYPYGSLFADITGYDSIYYGTSGVENYYDSILSTHNSPSGSLNGLLTTGPTTDNVVLTLNTKLQQIAQQAVSKYQLGAVVAIDPANGDILAMYGTPTYNPNLLAQHNIAAEKQAYQALDPTSPTTPLLSVAYQQRYAPGSTFKVITSSAVYDHDPSLATHNYPAVTQIPLPDTTRTLHNYAYESCGGQMPVLLEVSCDTGYAQLGLALGPQNMATEANGFGFNQVPPIDLPNAAVSYFPSAASFSNQLPFLAYSAIGQGNVQATCLQMATVVAGIANGGVMMTPHVMDKIVNSLGQTVQKYVPKPWKFATSATTAASVTSDMELVAEGGTAAGLFPPGQHIAAKTGTGQTAAGAGSNNWLEAFGPNTGTSRPPVAVVAVVPYYQGLGIYTTGNQIAGPIVSQVLEAAVSMGL